ncbi:hypothetical protein KM043_005304 [Ampulex compressa]|nr:hypothetical protein KM043_005304 [Ampulex compressa]
MDKDLPPNLQKWIKKCLMKEFGPTIQKALENDQGCSDITEDIIHSKDMVTLLNSLKNVVGKQRDILKVGSTVASESRPHTSFSYTSNAISDDWSSPKSNEDKYNNIVDKISCDKPDHVRLAGYEILLKDEFPSANDESIWNFLQKTLEDGLVDESRPIFEASLRVHAKLLNSSRRHEIYTNLLNGFNAHYHSERLFEILPTLISGINFKFFLHERLIRIMHLIIRHQEEMLKSIRTPDKNTEEIIEQFIAFLSMNEFSIIMHPKMLKLLNILSVLEPRADWSRRWMRCLATRKIFLSALSKSPNLMQNIIEYVQNGLKKIPVPMPISINDETLAVCISGYTIETATYLHCLNLVSELCSYKAGRILLSECPLEIPFSIAEFITELVRSLNKLSLEELNGVYNTSRYALQIMLNKPIISYQPEFYHVALCYLNSFPSNDIKIWPHTIDIISHMLDNADGSLFLVSTCKEHSIDIGNVGIKCPASIIIGFASNLLWQPFSIMNTEYILELFKVMEKLFDVYDTYEVSQDILSTEFYFAVSHFYNKLDKCFFENESKAQQIDSAIKKLLLKIVAIPLGLQALMSHSIILEELIRGFLAPLKKWWLSTNTVGFVPLAAYLQTGYNILTILAPHVLSTFISEVCKNLEDPHEFYDAWDSDNVKMFLHMLAIFSLNFKCFSAFITNMNELNDDEEESIPTNLSEVLHFALNFESKYHYLGLLSLHSVIWNLDACVFLIESINFQDELLKLQSFCTLIIDTEDGENEEYVIDDCSLLRHRILSNSYFVDHKCAEDVTDLEENKLFSTLPPPKSSKEETYPSQYIPSSELEDFLQESRPGLLDNNWVNQIREAHEALEGPLKNTVIVQLLEQMQKAIPTAEWVDNFQWQDDTQCNSEFWFPEEICGIDLTLNYAEQNKIMKNSTETRENLKRFIAASYAFIKYDKPKKFEGFDWFLATVFIVCEGDVIKCKAFVTQLIQFSSILYLWPSFGKVIDKDNNEESNTWVVFAQLLEMIINYELPHIKHTLKCNCGVDWWIICDAMLTQCFWGILPWSEIMHFFAICILYPPDHMIYYFTSLLYDCQSLLEEDLRNGKKWPEHMRLKNYQCCSYIRFMDTLSKRYGNKVLPKITIRKFNTTNES